ncbi:DMT family transporter [Nostoc parmelioides]|uniref:Multidrug efflux SMR transporter n=1 Tax=Nostoc parmelioides FACHB-3921 TaxID=2692909 RepID=A0ABR8BF47_9NOSO|nr:multidrug efflux SMR transporter [Nostoc parmelioides]MBD2252483.1 multidrug efflux SMR transporter [Nostoc parmelioides FACHB-3921]
MSTSLVYLLMAIIFEVSGTTCMKLSDGFNKLTPSILIFVFYGLCFTFQTLSLKNIDISIAYSVWAGLGTALIAGVGLIWFRESMTMVKFISMTLIMVGVVGINSGK